MTKISSSFIWVTHGSLIPLDCLSERASPRQKMLSCTSEINTDRQKHRKQLWWPSKKAKSETQLSKTYLTHMERENGLRQLLLLPTVSFIHGMLGKEEIATGPLSGSKS